MNTTQQSVICTSKQWKKSKWLTLQPRKMSWNPLVDIVASEHAPIGFFCQTLHALLVPGGIHMHICLLLGPVHEELPTPGPLIAEN
jgi:hypothetical protein